jgi:hypothetical protein
MVEQTLYVSPTAGLTTKLIYNEAYACIRIIGFIHYIEDNMYIWVTNITVVWDCKEQAWILNALLEN